MVLLRPHGSQHNTPLELLPPVSEEAIWLPLGIEHSELSDNLLEDC